MKKWWWWPPNWNQIPKQQPGNDSHTAAPNNDCSFPNNCSLTARDCSPNTAPKSVIRLLARTSSDAEWLEMKEMDGLESIWYLTALGARTGSLTLYQTISRSLPSVLKLHLRVTVSPTTTGGRGSMVTVKYPGKQRRGGNEFCYSNKPAKQLAWRRRQKWQQQWSRGESLTVHVLFWKSATIHPYAIIQQAQHGRKAESTSVVITFFQSPRTISLSGLNIQTNGGTILYLRLLWAMGHSLNVAK